MEWREKKGDKEKKRRVNGKGSNIVSSCDFSLGKTLNKPLRSRRQKSHSSASNATLAEGGVAGQYSRSSADSRGHRAEDGSRSGVAGDDDPSTAGLA